MGRKVNLRKKMAGDRTVDVYKSRRTTNLFFFFVAAAKASLFPFLTLYFRLLGLSATQTGILCGSKALMSMWTMPAWGNCAARFEKRRFVLLFTVFLLIAVNLGLTLVPPVDKDESLMFCHHEGNATKVTATEAANASQLHVFTTALPTSQSQSSSSSQGGSKLSIPSVLPTLTHSTSTEKPKQVVTAMNTNSTRITHPTSQSTNNTENSSNTSQPKRAAKHRQKRSVSETFQKLRTSITTKLQEWKNKIYALKHRTFIIVLVILLLGELLSSPVERVADDAWFDLLDNIDDLEKYGQHRTWASFAYVLFAIAVAAVVDNTNCLLKFHINHFMIHFYVFAALMAMAFFTALFYPIYDTEKPRKRAARSRIRVLCHDCRSVCFIFTALIVGFVYASINCFLFWRVQDIGGSEIQMGTAFSIGALSEFIFLLFGNRFIHKFGSGITICVGVFCLSLRLLYFSFISTPWALLPIEILSGFSGAGIWMALLSYPDFNVNPRTGRSVATALQALYYGFGYAAGAMLSGFLYDTLSLPIVFQGACVIAFVWCLFFALMNKCLPKRQRVRYTKLLQNDDDLSDTSDGFEDDWLEMAMKER